MADRQCRAYTFNTRENACFLKSAVAQRQGYKGALSARILDTDPRVLAQALARAAELDFLDDNDLRAARGLAEEIGVRHPGGGLEVDVMLGAAQERLAKQDRLGAMRWTGAAVATTDAADQWAEYARLTLMIPTEQRAERNRLADQALHAAINAYLRAPGPGMRATALVVMSDALEALGRGRDGLRALRLAESLQKRPDVLSALEDAIARYGFRVTDHRSDNESASPRICAEFSEPLIKAGFDYTPFVRLPDAGLAVQAEERQICIDGVQHGARYRITFRRGLPAASGEMLAGDVQITLYVRDRRPMVAFPGRAYVLPRATDAALPIETVNLDRVELILRRVSDRNLLRSIQEDYFARPLSYYEELDFAGQIAEEVWRGSGEVSNELNRTMTTRLPLGAVLSGESPGIYALTARVPTDLGLTTLKGVDGLHVFVRGLGDARALKGVELTLLTRSNRVLGSAQTDAQGHALFAPGLMRGKDGAAPALVVARRGAQDLAFLSLTEPAFDLSDRGVEGRPPAPPVDVFLATDRGAYRPGEVIHATALARDGVAAAIEGLPLTAILRRPDGVEHSRQFSSEDRAGGHVFHFPLGESMPRGSWTLGVTVDPEAGMLASRTVLVEDFLPERIDFDLELPDAPIRPGDTVPLAIAARHLFGAPGAGLKADGTLTLQPRRRLEGYPGYRFGRHDERISPRASHVEGGVTDARGRLLMPVEIPKAENADRPFEAIFRISLREGSGRPVEREISRLLAPAGPMIGIRPEFDDVVPEGAEASFLLTAIGADMAPMDMQARWTLNRVETRYQWYQEYGNWNWEPITTRSRIARGEARLGAEPVRVAAAVGWGRYELVVERSDGPYVASSEGFVAGWHAPADASATPDTLELSLDKSAYRPGDTATLRLVPRYGGTALITVLSNRVIEMKAVEVEAGETLVPLVVTDDWGAGTYVTAQLIRPMDVAAGQNPARALGLAYARTDPGARQFGVVIEAPARADPRGPLEAAVRVEGIKAGETAHVTLAAVDLGILNMTGFQGPDPSEHYFGQRRLGVEIRDLYGRLIDGLDGAEGRVRSGGDAVVLGRFRSPPPQEEPVALFSGPLRVGEDGRALARFDLPDFNGTVRLMAVAWSASAVGQAERDVLVRDPVVVTATLPRFLAPGDESRLLLEIVNVDGPAGRMGLDIAAEGLRLSGTLPPDFDLGAGEKVVFSLPVQAGEVGDHALRVALTMPDGRVLTRSLTLGVRANDPEISQTRRLSLAPGARLVLDDNLLAGLRPETASVIVSAGPLARLNAPALLRALDRYPYGCTEQVTSRAMPLLYFGLLARTLGIGDAGQVGQRIDEAIAQILARQSSSGAFGLWQPGSGDFWLDAYVTDFLSRARAQGHAVPDRAFAMAMDNLRNRINYAPDFDHGGEDVAYALMVLAREGAANTGELRYHADVKAEALATPLALAQLGAALALYGDRTRAERMFALAVRRLEGAAKGEGHRWRSDYGTRLRDRLRTREER